VPSKEAHQPELPITISENHTFAKRDDREVGPAEEARVDAWKLVIDYAHELLVARRIGAVRGRRNDAIADVVGVSRVLAVRDRRGDEVRLVRDAGRVCEVDHVVRVVLLVADAACRQERVDTVDAC